MGFSAVCAAVTADNKDVFFRKPEFELLKKCDGNTHISLEELSEEEKDLLAR